MYNVQSYTKRLLLGLWPLERVNIKFKIAIEISCLTSYLIAMIMIALSVTIFKIFAVEIGMIITLTNGMDLGQMQIY